MRRLLPTTLLALALALALAACAAQPAVSPSAGPTETPASPSPVPTGGSSPAPSPIPTDPIGSPTPGPTPSPTAQATLSVDSPAQAAALVLESDPRFYGIGPPLLELIGQCCWYQAHMAVGHFVVTVEVGWGDCPSGCIESHRWLYHVALDGAITLVEQEGDEPVQREPSMGTGPGTLTLTARAGPTCPVQQVPPDPACAPQPVAGAELVVFDPRGNEVQRALANDEGQVVLELPDGAYYVEALPVEGLMGVPQPVAVSVGPGGRSFLILEYDTGIR